MISVNPFVRTIANLTMSGVVGGTIAYLVFLLVGYRFPAWVCGLTAVFVYLMAWMGSFDDSANA